MVQGMNTAEFTRALAQMQADGVLAVVPVRNHRGELLLAEVIAEGEASPKIGHPIGKGEHTLMLRRTESPAIGDNNIENLTVSYAYKGQGFNSRWSAGSNVGEAGVVRMYKIDQSSSLHRALSERMESEGIPVIQLTKNSQFQDALPDHITQELQAIDLKKEMPGIIQTAEHYEQGIRKRSGEVEGRATFTDVDPKRGAAATQLIEAYKDFTDLPANASTSERIRRAQALSDANQTLEALVGGQDGVMNTAFERNTFGRAAILAASTKGVHSAGLRTAIKEAQQLAGNDVGNVSGLMQTSATSSQKASASTAPSSNTSAQTNAPAWPTRPVSKNAPVGSSSSSSSTKSSSSSSSSSSTDRSASDDEHQEQDEPWYKKYPGMVLGGIAGAIAFAFAAFSGLGGAAIIVGLIALLIGAVIGPKLKDYFNKDNESGHGLTADTIQHIDGLDRDTGVLNVKSINRDDNEVISSNEIKNVLQGIADPEQKEKVEAYILSELKKQGAKDGKNGLDISGLTNPNINLPKIDPPVHGATR